MGGDDRIVPVVNGHILKTLIRDSELRIIEGGGHLFMLSHLDESLAAIRQHLDAD